MAIIRNFFFRVIVTLLPLFTGVAGVAHAGDEEPNERTARKACLSGDYLKGIEILSDLFISTKEPTHIYNQGRCYEQNGQFEKAILRFREFLVLNAKTTTPEDRAEAERHIANCQALMKTNQAEGSVTPVPPPTGSTTDDPAPSIPTAPSGNHGAGLRIAGLVSGGVGLASIGAGLYFYTRAISYSDKVSNQEVPNPSDESAGKRAETLQWVFYGVGGAALATGVVLYVLGSQGEGSHPRVAGIAPWFGSGSLGLSAQGLF
jgi:tetratricopeptide (TPR) repeat protein